MPIALCYFFFSIFTFLLDLVGESMGHLKFVMNLYLSMNSDNVFAPLDFFYFISSNHFVFHIVNYLLMLHE